MASVRVVKPPCDTSVGMGQIAVAKGPARLTAVLGSCIGVALYHERLHLGSLAHVVLPKPSTRATPPGKFAETAIPEMITLLEKQGANRAGLKAKITGGACMFGTTGPMQIGNANTEAVLQALQAARIPVVAQETGGNKGRRIHLDCQTGVVTVDCVGAPSKTL